MSIESAVTNSNGPTASTDRWMGKSVIFYCQRQTVQGLQKLINFTRFRFDATNGLFYFAKCKQTLTGHVLPYRPGSVTKPFPSSSRWRLLESKPNSCCKSEFIENGTPTPAFVYWNCRLMKLTLSYLIRWSNNWHNQRINTIAGSFLFLIIPSSTSLRSSGLSDLLLMNFALQNSNTRSLAKLLSIHPHSFRKQ